MTNARPPPPQPPDPPTPKSRAKGKARPRPTPAKPTPTPQSSQQAPSTPRAPAKRQRPPITREPDTKRAKPSTPRAKPSSPSSSHFRARGGGNSRKRGAPSTTASADGGAVGGDAVPPGAISATSRRNGKPRARTPTLPSATSFFTIEGRALLNNVKYITLSRRYFGHEIQCLMHAFGEVRYCARDVLQMVEDAVREAIIRLATSAHASSDGLNILSVSQVICGDARAVARMNQSLKASHVETRVQPRERTWDILSDFCLGEKLNVADIHAHCSWRALHAFRASMTTQEFQDFAMCRSVTLVRQTSRSRASRVRGMQRIILFREWLSLPKEWEVSDDVLHALGHIAWESIGELTQTALTVRYFDDLKKGHADPRSSGWTHGRHLIAAVAYGLGTGIMVPLTEVQAAGLRNEMDAFMSGGAARWRGYVYASSRCLLPCHVTEALRRLESRHESIFSREGSGHGLFGGS